MNKNFLKFEDKQFAKLTVIEKDGEFFFIGKEVAAMLGYSITRDALARHAEDDDKGVVKYDTLGGVQNIVAINESSYLIILS